MDNTDSIAGCILGTAVGDALGLPYEGLTRRRAARLLGPPDRYRFLFRRGMFSDDTEHTCIVAQALVSAGAEPDRFARALAWRFRWWLLGLPAGLGRATLKACVKLWFGAPASRSGVFSAGNGPAMRAAIFGAAIEHDRELAEMVRVSTQITHTDPKAEFGALVVAIAAQSARRGEYTGDDFAARLRNRISSAGDELTGLIQSAVESVNHQQTTLEFADQLGLGSGVSGYVYHTVPVSIHAWLSHPTDFRAAVTAAIECGGDADTTAAIVGGIVGAGVGVDGIPEEWLKGLSEWPRSVVWMERLAEQLAECRSSEARARPIDVFPGTTLLRNLVFLAVVLAHGFRRVLPPY